MTEVRTPYRPPEPNGTSAIDAAFDPIRTGVRPAQAHQTLNSLFGRPVTVGDAVSNRLDNRSSLPGIHPTTETPIALSDIPLGPDHPSTVSGLVYAAGNHAWLDSKHHVMTDSVAQTFREKTGLDYMTTNSADLPVGGMEGDFVRSAEQRAQMAKELEALQQKAAFAELSGPEKLSVRTLNLVLAAEQAPQNIRDAVTAFWDNAKGWIPPINKRTRVALSATAALAASTYLAACGGAGPKAPDATPRVTTYPTATLVLPTPTEVPPTATFTAIPPTATPEPSPTVRPRPTPDKSISPVKIEPNLMAQELTKTAAGQVLLNRIDDLAKEIGSTRANVLTYLDVSYSTDPATGQVKYAFANVRPGGGFGPLSTTVGLDSGAFVAGDLKFESKQEDLLNNQYPKMDVDGKRLIVSTGLASSVAGVHVKEIKPDVFKRKFVAYGDDGSIVAEASMDIDSSPVKSKEKGSEGKPLPDWKAVIGFLPPTPVVVGEIFTGTAQPAKTATAEAQVTPEVKRMQAMGFTENVSVLPNEYFSNTKPLIDALRRSNPEAEKLMNDYFVSALTALIDHNPTPSASRIAEVQTKLAAARKDGKPFLVEENLQEVAGWDSEGKPLFPTPSEQAAKPYKIDFSKPVIMTFETEKDLEMRLKRGGTGSVDSTIRTAIDPKNGQLYIGVLDAPGLVDSSISAFDGNRNLALAFNTLAQPAVSLYWASDSSASKAPLVSIPKGFTNRGQAPVVAWNRAHGNDFDTKR